MVSVFSSAAGDVISDLERLAVQGRLEEAPRILTQLEAMVHELQSLVKGLSIDILRASS
jgi:hypothetical protein